MIIRREQANAFDAFEFPEDNLHYDSLRESIPTYVDPVAKMQKAADDAYQKESESAYQQGFEQGQKIGYEEGVKSGEVKGFEHGTKMAVTELAPLKKTFISLSNNLNQLGDQYKSLIRETTLQLTKVITQKVTETEIQMDPSIIRRWIEGAIDELPEQPSEIAIYLSNKDMGLLDSNFRDCFKDCTLKESNLLESGQVDVRTDIVDIFIDAKRKIDELVDSYHKH
ncbi:FliH/SctL family protein [Vibrio sp.]|nr:FliH/SctL family protein [Vibrio sp.]